MKKVKFIVILCSILMFGVQSVNAQWFQDREIRWFSQGGSRGDDGDDPNDPYIPPGEDPDPNSPIGSGVAILLGLGAGYACVKRSCKEKSGP